MQPNVNTRNMPSEMSSVERGAPGLQRLRQKGNRGAEARQKSNHTQHHCALRTIPWQSNYRGVMLRKHSIGAMSVELYCCRRRRGRLMRTLLLFAGLVAILLGALWIGQGTGLLMWPASSYMLQQTQWAYYGAALVIIGLLALVYSGRSRG
jgi:hypothetical protein